MLRYLFVIIFGIFGVVVTFTIPWAFLYFIVFTITSGAIVRFVMKRTGVVDIGLNVGKPLAKFKIRNQVYRIRLIPLGIGIDDQADPNCEIVVSLLLLCVSFILLTFSFYIDGWPELETQGPAVIEENQNGAARLGWGEKLNGNEQIKIIEVKEDSPAAKAGLNYGDIIEAINDIQRPSLLDVTNTVMVSEQVQLHINRQGEAQTLLLTRDQTQGSQTPDFGFTFGLAVGLKNNVVVQAVKVGGEAFNQGIRPSNLLWVSPPGPYLSVGMLKSGLLNKKYDAIIVGQTSSLPWNIDAAAEREEEKFPASSFPLSQLNAGWADSLVIRERYKKYSPTFLESLKLSISCFVSRFPYLPSRGSRISASPSVYYSAGFNPYWKLIKAFANISIFMSFFYLISALFHKMFGAEYQWLGLGIFLGTMLINYLRLPSVDSLLLRLITLLPFGDMLFILGS